MQKKHIAWVYFSVNSLLVMVYLIVNLVGSMQYIQSEYVVCSTSVCTFCTQTNSFMWNVNAMQTYLSLQWKYWLLQYRNLRWIVRYTMQCLYCALKMMCLKNRKASMFLFFQQTGLKTELSLEKIRSKANSAGLSVCGAWFQVSDKKLNYVSGMKYCIFRPNFHPPNNVIYLHRNLQGDFKS